MTSVEPGMSDGNYGDSGDDAMSAVVVISYLALAERWEVVRRDAVLIGDPEEIAPGVWVSRSVGDATQAPTEIGEPGTIAEIVADGPEWTAAGLDAVTEAFGAVVRTAVESLVPEGDLEVEVRIPVAGRAAPPARAESREVSLPGEPGIPVPVTQARSLARGDAEDLALFDVPGVMGEAGASAVSAGSAGSAGSAVSAQILLRQGDLRIQLPATSGAAGMWVRISAATTGAVVHIAPLRVRPASSTTGSDPRAGADAPDSSEGAGGRGAATPGSAGQIVEARVTWGLDDDLRRVHVVVTTDPTLPVGDRATRRRAWAEDLLSAAGEGSPTPRRPQRIRVRRHAARQAAQVADTVGDATLRERARIQLRRLDRQRWIRAGVIAAGAVALGVATALLVSGARSGPEGTGADNIGPGVNPGTGAGEVVDVGEVGEVGDVGEIGPISAGPARFVFPDRSEVRASVTGRVPVLPAGETLTLDVVHTAVIFMGYSPPETDLSVEIATALARTNCLSAVNTLADGRTYGVAVRPLLVKLVREPRPTDGGVAEVIPVLASLPPNWAQWSSILETCNLPEFGPGNRYSGEAITTSEPLRVEVPIPVDLPAGVWRLEVLLESAEADEVIGAVRIRVTG